MKKWSMGVCAALCLMFLLIFSAGPAKAQQSTADIVGTVTDASGGVLPDATVTLTNMGTGISQTMKTGSSGDYSFPQVQIGAYTVKVEMKGFKTSLTPAFTLATGDRARQDMKLDVGEQSTTVEVSAAAAPALHTDTATVDTLITPEAVQDIPLDGRNITRLLWLTAGAQSVQNSGTGALNAGNAADDRRVTSAISVNGQDDFTNNYMVDGMDNNATQTATSAIRPSIDAIQEVVISTNIYDASLTRTAGGNINIVTKSGTNGFHGSAFDFFRNEVLNANPGYAFPSSIGCKDQGTASQANCTADVTPSEWNVLNRSGVPANPPFQQNQYGGSIGGPIKKNKTFFFGDFEKYRQKIGLNTLATVPTDCERGFGACPDGHGNTAGIPGDFSDEVLISPLGGGTATCQQAAVPGPGQCAFAPDIQPSQFDPIGLAYFNMYPRANLPGTSGNYFSAPPELQTSTTFDVRVDQHFSDKDTLFGRFSYNLVNTNLASSTPIVTLTNATDPLIPSGKSVTVDPSVFLANNSLPGTSVNHERGVGLSWVHVFSPTVVLDTKAGYVESLINTRSSNAGQANIAEALGFPCNAVSCINQAGFAGAAGIPVASPAGAFLQTAGAPGYNTEGDSIFLPIIHLDNTWQYSTALTINKGNQTIKMGIGLIRRQQTFAQSSNGRGTFSFSGAFTGTPGGDMLTGESIGGSLRSLLLISPGLRVWEPGAYVQDDWHTKRWLTLNMGLRYDVFTPATEKRGRLAQFNPATGLMVSPSIAGAQQSSNTGGINIDWLDLAPRFGFAASLPHQTVLRGGFGLSFFRDNSTSSASLTNVPFIFNTTCGPQNHGGTATPCGAAFTNGATVNYGNPNGPTSIVGASGGGIQFSSGMPAPFFNITQVLAPASCTLTSVPTSPGCAAPTPSNPNGNPYATFNPSSLDFPNFPAQYLEQFSLQAEKQFGGSVVSIGYVGELGRRIHDGAYNPFTRSNSSSTVPANPVAATFPWLDHSNFSLQKDWGTSSYNSLQTSFVHRFNRGLTVNANYVYAHSLSSGQQICTPTWSFSALGYGNGAKYQYPCIYDNVKNPGSPLDVTALDDGPYSVGNTAFDIRHRITGTLNYQLPFMKSAKGIEGALLGGWATNLAASWQTGLPYSVTAGATPAGNSVGGGRPDPVTCTGFNSAHSELLGWLNPSCFGETTVNQYGTEAANQLHGPPQRSADFSVFKTFNVKENLKMQFRTEIFNIFNTPNFNPPSGAISCFGLTASGPSNTCANTAGATGSSFNANNPGALPVGTITAKNSNAAPREIQFALKLLF